MCARAALDGHCKIFMGGAAHHKRILDPAPNSQSVKGDNQKWLTDHDIEYPETATRAQLLQLVIQSKPKKLYAARAIAQIFEHEVYLLHPAISSGAPANRDGWQRMKWHENRRAQWMSSKPSCRVPLTTSTPRHGQDHIAHLTSVSNGLVECLSLGSTMLCSGRVQSCSEDKGHDQQLSSGIKGGH